MVRCYDRDSADFFLQVANGTSIYANVHFIHLRVANMNQMVSRAH